MIILIKAKQLRGFLLQDIYHSLISSLPIASYSCQFARKSACLVGFLTSSAPSFALILSVRLLPNYY